MEFSKLQLFECKTNSKYYRYSVLSGTNGPLWIIVKTNHDLLYTNNVAATKKKQEIIVAKNIKVVLCVTFLLQ